MREKDMRVYSRRIGEKTEQRKAQSSPGPHADYYRKRKKRKEDELEALREKRISVI